MADHADRVRSLETKIASLESHLQALRDDLSAARRDATSSRPSLSRSSTGRDAECPIGLATFESAYGSEVLAALGASDEPEHKRPLDLDEYKRYGRQMIMPEIGLPGQLRLKKARVLIVGVGGLGCPASMYLAGAGVGTLGLVDGDEVEISNLHRQVLHNTDTVGMGKVDSAILGLRKYVACFLCVSRLRVVDNVADFLSLKVESCGQIRTIPCAAVSWDCVGDICAV